MLGVGPEAPLACVPPHCVPHWYHVLTLQWSSSKSTVPAGRRSKPREKKDLRFVLREASKEIGHSDREQDVAHQMLTATPASPKESSGHAAIYYVGHDHEYRGYIVLWQSSG